MRTITFPTSVARVRTHRIGARSLSHFARCGTLALAAISCGSAECLNHPCPLPDAITVTVTSSMGGESINGAFVSLSYGTLACTQSPGSTCRVQGNAGTYELDIGAPHFRTVHRTVMVAGIRPTSACGCETLDTQHLDIALVIAPDPPPTR